MVHHKNNQKHNGSGNSLSTQESSILDETHVTLESDDSLTALRRILTEQAKQIHDLQNRPICTCNTGFLARTRKDPCFTALLVLTLTALLKCLISVELVNQRLDAIGAEPLKLAPRPWAPFLWLGHLLLWVWRIFWNHFSSAVERLLAALVTGVCVSVAFVWWTNRPSNDTTIKSQSTSLPIERVPTPLLDRKKNRDDESCEPLLESILDDLY